MDRRSFLSLGGGAATMGALLAVGGGGRAVAACAAGVAEGANEDRLAEFALATRYEEMPGEVVTAVKRVLLDTLGCAFAAVGSEAAVIAEATVRETYGNGTGATIIGQASRATIEGATFVNGVLVRSLDLNDTYIGTEPLHPSELIPAALAMAEEGRRSGRHFIEALVAGYEASMRVTDAVSFMERGFHPLCAMSYGAPLVAGKVWGLQVAPMAHAVGLSAARGYTSFVVNSGAISMMKAMGFSATAADAVFVTRLAARGFTGPRGTLEWLGARMKPGRPDLDLDLDRARWRLPRVAFKRFPIQIELQSVAEAGSALAARVRPRVGDIREIRVDSYPGIIARVADPAKFKPQTKGTADHSLPVCLALALLDGDVTVGQFEHDRWRDREVMALVEKTTVRPGEALMARLPKGRGATVEVVFADGSSLRETVDVPEGDASRPLSRGSLVRKFNSLSVPVIGAARAERIADVVDRLEEIADMRMLAELLAG